MDQDGPLADFDRQFFARCEQNGWEMDCTVETQTARFATDHIPNGRERHLARKMVDSPGWFSELPVTPGAVDGLRELAEYAEVWICSKPLEANPTCRDEKAAWLARHFGKEWAARLILAPDKSLVHGDILLDDAIKPEWLERATWTPVVFPTPWNDGELPTAGRWTWGNYSLDLILGTEVVF